MSSERKNRSNKNLTSLMSSRNACKSACLFAAVRWIFSTMAIMSTMDVQRSWLSKSEACCMAWGLCWNWSAVVSVFHAFFIFRYLQALARAQK